ncbi:MAG: hypothetical protein CMI08_18015 [Oceanospirillaceae bacterium]|uniref:hypothetical protein n=1 Tax=unclassified Thalassolituus TaxID=2624967 RepID=UPI000C09AF46|nr:MULTISPECIES: hypothetical protein [unclassified Thalassolituus]MAK92192.1 hypothetical protein [Thalassolituus sp.]MAS26084.1 hypothetical protein [Oceanospirillaceae bacterium]MAY01063.1 hypothetical protein [Oceanospirillaceae bacterium]MBL36559.1 hypothetical protein [Oceanospirillaceae bacterium]MBS53373.1 hypothetical protein [Oceanospirillaceae bacterium]|tara:strand:+ start:285 stop:581 length:297 start_codon:yes stop_codon:yes gene_type:complete
MSDEDLEMDDQLEDDSDMESEDENNSNDNSDDSDSKEEDLVAADISHTSLEARNKIRESMAAEVEAFLSRGGQIQQIDDNVMADPPRKPQTNYGSRPI